MFVKLIELFIEARGDGEVFRLNCKINDERSTSQTLHPKPKIKNIPMPNSVNVVLNDIQPSQLEIAISENQKGKAQKVNAALTATLSDLLIFFLHCMDKEVIIIRIVIDNHSGNSREL